MGYHNLFAEYYPHRQAKLISLCVPIYTYIFNTKKPAFDTGCFADSSMIFSRIGF